MKELNREQVQKATLELMNNLHNICEKNNLKYILAYGTLIGAIRHNGFIPWDDDLDIMMPRKDFETLINYFKENEQELYPLKIFSPELVEDYPYMIVRVSDDRYVIDTENEKDCGMGVFIDIYPLDGLGNDYKQIKKDMKITNYLSSLYFRSTRLNPIIREGFSTTRKLLEKILFYIATFKTKHYFYEKLKAYSQKYSYEKSKYVGCTIWHTGVEKDIYEKSWIENVEKHNFEGYQFYIPSEYDHILTMLYGNYMQLPPEEDRIGHHFYKTYLKEE